jgi:hypothetical protein
MGWSVWYATRYFRRSEEWGPTIAALEQAEWNIDAAGAGDAATPLGGSSSDDAQYAEGGAAVRAAT